MKDSNLATKSILCLGNSWFPNLPGGLDRYVYELTHYLVAAAIALNCVELVYPKHHLIILYN